MIVSTTPMNATEKARIVKEYFADDAGRLLMIVCVAFGVLETLALGAYFGSRWIKKGGWKKGGSKAHRVEPWLMVCGYGFCVGLCVQSYRKSFFLRFIYSTTLKLYLILLYLHRQHTRR
jgi:hypothetical protein